MRNKNICWSLAPIEVSYAGPNPMFGWDFCLNPRRVTAHQVITRNWKKVGPDQADAFGNLGMPRAIWIKQDYNRVIKFKWASQVVQRRHANNLVSLSRMYLYVAANTRGEYKGQTIILREFPRQMIFTLFWSWIGNALIELVPSQDVNRKILLNPSTRVRFLCLQLSVLFELPSFVVVRVQPMTRAVIPNTSRHSMLKHSFPEF